jgi:hypothetical protein
MLEKIKNKKEKKEREKEKANEEYKSFETIKSRSYDQIC